VSVVKRLARAWLPPFVAAALMLGAFAAAARYSGRPFLDYDTWIKWDSGHYLTIANKGYEFMSCAEVPGYDPSLWCGNSGWFPGYPFLLRALHEVTGQPTIRLAVLVSQGFTIIDLWLVWNLFLGRQNLVVLVLCAFGPGTYYFLVGFPVSLAVCFILVALWAQREDRPVIALLSGALAGLTYPSAIWLAGVAVVELLIRQWRGARPTVGAWLAAAGPAIGFGSVLLIHYVAVGHWNAFFLTQEKYGHGVYNPLAVLWLRARTIWAWEPTWWQIGLQSLLAATLVVCGTIGIAAAARRRTGKRGDLFLSLYGLVFWLMPLVLGRVSSYRAEALLIPMTTAAARFPMAFQVALLGGAVAIWMVMVTQFIKGALV
jgi:hypothetical protein